MSIKQTFQMALRNLFANKVRFFHATLGMLIGIAGFVVALSCGNLSATAIQLTGDEYDPALLKTCTYVSIDLPMQVIPKDMTQLADDNPDVIKGISPYVEFDLSGGVRYGERTADEAQIYGVNGSYIDMMPVLCLQEGRFFEDIDIARERKVCVIGSSIANNLLDGDALGKELKVWGENYKVIGIFAEVPNEPYPKRNIEVYIPYPNALKMVGETIISMNDYKYTYFACANGKENLYEMQVLIKEMLKERTGRDENNGWTLQAWSMGGSMERLREYVLGVAIQQALCASIVLLIGGVGVMNIMLVSVQARTKEIGIRKAFGATNRDIQQQFALEAVITSLVGGLIGVIVGFVGMFVICKYDEIPLRYLTGTIWPMLAAVGVTVLVGVLSGLYPANKAAKMEIVDAINSD